MSNLLPVALIDGPIDTCEMSSRCTWNKTKPVSWCSLHEHEEVCKYMNPDYKLIGCYHDEQECQKNMMIYQSQVQTSKIPQQPSSFTTTLLPYKMTKAPISYKNKTTSMTPAVLKPAVLLYSTHSPTKKNRHDEEDDRTRSLSSKSICNIM